MRGTLDQAAVRSVDHGRGTRPVSAMTSTPERRGIVTVTETDMSTEEELTFLALGRRIRALRTGAGLTIKTLAARTDLSTSMLSMVERGQAKPSVGSLVRVASALGVQTGELFEDAPDVADPVIRRERQSVIHAGTGVTRRVVRSDRTRGVEISIHQYDPQASSSLHEHRHGGYEYGVILEGTIDVELEHQTYSLAVGDSIAFDSSCSHRMLNPSSVPAMALWVNLDH